MWRGRDLQMIFCQSRAPTSPSMKVSLLNISVCDAGYEPSGANGRICNECNVGRYKSVVGNNGCLSCGNGEFTQQTGSTSVQQCGTHWFYHSPGYYDLFHVREVGSKRNSPRWVFSWTHRPYMELGCYSIFLLFENSCNLIG